MQVQTAILTVLKDNGSPLAFNTIKKRVKALKPDKAKMLDISQALADLISERKVVYHPSKMRFSLKV